MATMAKASDNLKNLLNQAIARELQVATQYMWQHVLWSGVKGYAVKDVFKKIAIVEMKHAETIAERLVYLGGQPTTKPTPILVGENLKEMIAQDVKDEEGAITLYRNIIETANKEGDLVTRRLFEEIVAEEEDHHDTFTSLLEDL
jgi:bacterioferritin